MTIEKEAIEIVKKNMKNSPDCSCEEDDFGCQVYDWVNEETMLIKDIASALQKKQDRIDELESALREIHRLCRTLEPIDATMRIIQVKEKAIGYGK